MVDRSYKDFESKTLDEQHIFLWTEFERMMEECNYPLEYILDLFLKDLKSEGLVFEKYQYRSRKKNLDCIQRVVIS